MKKRNILEVKTQFGMLCSEIGGDTDNYPEIFVYLRNEKGIEIDLCAVGTAKDDNKLNAYLWADTSTDSFTNKHSWVQEEFDFEE